jgi:ornithine--oxo-acid transaminase
LIISEAEIQDSLRIIKETLLELPSLKGSNEDEIIPPTEKGVKIHLEA